jgi:hypothetical protein
MQSVQDNKVLEQQVILLGRGGGSYNNAGNRMLRRLVKEHKQQHANGPLQHNVRQRLIREIYLTCQDGGYRFLVNMGTCGWIEASMHTTMKMIGRELRDAPTETQARGSGPSNAGLSTAGN